MWLHSICLSGGGHTDTFTRYQCCKLSDSLSLEPHTRLRGHPRLRSAFTKRSECNTEMLVGFRLACVAISER
ncbi:MAG: hypothetical protein JWO91_416 [Acidobacteriaceae bacterium]|nr:hypothetical protein [Acidobacteriaceae bacterium]